MGGQTAQRQDWSPLNKQHLAETRMTRGDLSKDNGAALSLMKHINSVCVALINEAVHV